jgi:serine/threonine protein kinase
LTEGSKLTKLDITVGTVAYMSPEQAQGAEVDHRTDLWALGCVLYEMVRGERPFPGVHDQALLYEIVNEDPEPLAAVRAGVPMELELLVAKCLAKEAGDRYQSASELIVDLRTLADKLKSGRSTILKTTAEPAPNLVGAQRAAPASSLGDEAVSKSKPRLPWVLLAAAMIALAAISILSFTQAPIERPVRKWSFTPEALAVNFVYRSVAVSPNGRSIAYVAGPGVPRLWVRDVDRLEPRGVARNGGGRSTLLVSR